MEKSGLLISIFQSVYLIDFGRKKLASEVNNSEGRMALMRGLSTASHVTRLRNTLRTPGINDTERQVYAQRVKNMSAAQNAYLALQKKALSCDGQG